MVEFGMTRDGPVLFEVNPRWWGSLALAIVSGVDFPKIYRDVVVGGAEPVVDWKEGVVCKHFLFGDIMHFAARRAPLRFVRSLFETMNFDVLSFRDPGPGLARFPLAIEMQLRTDLRERYLKR